MSSIMWECKCGHIEYREEPPEDCPKCLRINNFKQIPEDLMEAKTRGFLMEDNKFEKEMGIDDIALDEVPRTKTLKSRSIIKKSSSKPARNKSAKTKRKK